METKEEQPVPAVGGMVLKSKTVFSIPDEELKAYYLKEAVLLTPTYCATSKNEFQILSILQSQQKRILGFLTNLINHRWEKTMVNLNLLSIPYVLQGDISAKEKKRVCTELAEHSYFLSLLVSNCHVIKQLFAIYNQHYANVDRLLKQFPEYREKKDKNVLEL